MADLAQEISSRLTQEADNRQSTGERPRLWSTLVNELLVAAGQALAERGVPACRVFTIIPIEPYYGSWKSPTRLAAVPVDEVRRYPILGTDIWQVYARPVYDPRELNLADATPDGTYRIPYTGLEGRPVAGFLDSAGVATIVDQQPICLTTVQMAAHWRQFPDEPAPTCELEWDGTVHIGEPV
ncbi:MAG: hypothetical protein LBE83_01935, partial [Propionibacteriaceae bacterium]|nr:hypothetical protein [Propionibacteriaceae bacterium]